MKKGVLILVGAAVLAVAPLAMAQQYTNGYYRNDGTYTNGYYRSTPNGTVTDNYGFKGNTNPYTGSTGSNYYRSAPSSPYYNGSPRIVQSPSTGSPFGNSYPSLNRTYRNPYGYSYGR